ncbi:alpha/beta hydrolase domain-containing protein [Pseudoduganella namucuonensis]|nr:alpha/beta hydrolase domain-containing protein [Pseudoduganella namucuonensis]
MKKHHPNMPAETGGALRHAACLLAAACLAACGGNNGSAVPLPAVEAIVAAGAPLNATPLPLQTYGYVEQEFQVRGRANRYRMPDAMGNAQLIDAGHPYATRVLVRRPADPARFNGTVVVEWLNVTTGQDIDFIFAATRELLLREGYAWVGVSAQRAGVEALARWNPQRYGTLSVAASNLDPASGAEIDPAAFPAVGGDVLGWDVYSQVGAAIAKGTSPLMGGLTVKRIIAAGESQSTARLTTYHNSIQPLHRVYDGFFLYDRGGPMRKDTGVKVVGIGTEFMNLFAGPPPADTADTRWWEIAGAAHVSLAEVADYLDPVILRDGALRAPNGAALSLSDAVNGGNCAVTPIWSRVPNADILKAGLKGLDAWIGGGPAPAGAARIAMAGPGRMLRDAEGRVQGGVRTAAYDAPVAVNYGVNAGGGFCALAGYHLDYTPAEMCRRYGGKQAYVAKVRALAEANVKDGMLLPEEAKRTVDEAQGRSFDCAGG